MTSDSYLSFTLPNSMLFILHLPVFVFLQVLGQVGKVLKVYADGDLRVAFGGQTWTFNPACLKSQPTEVDANLMTAENPSDSGSKASSGTRGLISDSTAPALPCCLCILSSSPAFHPALALLCMLSHTSCYSFIRGPLFYFIFCINV